VYRKPNKSGVTQKKRTPMLIVSLTSHPPRINTVHIALHTLLNQTLKPDKIILWLTDNQFSNKENDLPESLLKLCKYGLTIEWCKDDIKSHTKLIPTLKKYPKDIIVVADDDIYYRKNWLELLFYSYILNPDKIHCHKARRISFNHNKILEYTKWKFCSNKCNDSYLNFLMGVGGVLFPPNTLYKDIYNYELSMKLTPKADDIWFWAMAVLQGTKIKVINSENRKTLAVEEAFELNDLWSINSQGYNDVQLNCIFDYYKNLYDAIYNEWSDNYIKRV